jgi:hypothetical protein
MASEVKLIAAVELVYSYAICMCVTVQYVV